MLENLTLTRIAVHEVLTVAALQTQAPKHSTSLVSLDGQGEALICDRLANSIGSDSHCEEMLVSNEEPTSAFRAIAELMFATDPEFVIKTASLADRLSNAQSSGSVRDGLGVFVQGSGTTPEGPRKWLAIVKADPDRGFVKVSDGNQINLRYVADLVMGAHQRLLKVAFFVEENQAASADLAIPEDFNIKVYDHLLSNTGRGSSAVYFYSTFLGLKPADNSAKMCRLFYEKSRDFTDSFSTDAAERMLYRGHLASYLRSEKQQISVREFAETYIPQAHRRAYLRSMRDGRVPENAIRRDIALIKSKLRKTTMKFTSKVVIVVTDGDHQNQVQIGDVVQISGEDWTEMKIKGRLE